MRSTTDSSCGALEHAHGTGRSHMSLHIAANSVAPCRLAVPSYRYTPAQVAAGVGVAATVLAGGVAASKSSAVSDALSEQADLAWERLESVVPPLQV